MAINWSDTTALKDHSKKSAEWHEIHNNPLIRKPFLAYVGTTGHKKFADWLYQYGDTANSEKEYEKRYGIFEPKNLQEQALRVNRSQQPKKVNTQIEKKLKKMQEELLIQEKQLYKDLGCQNFKGFKDLWEGNTLKGIEDSSSREYWIRYHLKLLTGETLRLATDKEQTQIEQILAMAAIKLDKFGIEGVEKHKDELKRELLRADYLQIVEQVYKRTGKNINVYVPVKETKGDSEASFISIIREFLAKDLAKRIGDTLEDILTSSFQQQLDWALGEVQQVMTRKTLEENDKTLDASYVWMDFSSAATVEEQAQVLADLLKKFFSKARKVEMDDTEWENWKNVNKDGQMEKYINDQFEKVCLSLCRNNNPFSIAKYEALYKSKVMGLLGEIAAQGQAYFHLLPLNNSERKIEVFNVGMLRSTETGQFLGTDTVIAVNNRNYGIQVKNPFQLDKGFYNTYKADFGFDSPAKIAILKNFFGFDQEQFEAFEMYNVNINNTTNPEYFVKQMKQFLTINAELNADVLARLDEQHVQNEMTEQQEKTMSQLAGSSVNNVFFIVKGEIFPSSYLLQGLINQFYYIINAMRKLKKSPNAKTQFNITYKNPIKKNLVTDRREESRPFVEVGEKYVVRDISELLKKITIQTILHLEIPSINNLNKFYKDIGW